ncbi:MAG: hypothetical protein JXQ73_32645 [Phycisphaerae bacterium]|nr:hypothetical protein [Phycisphaerae bacterium]
MSPMGAFISICMFLAGADADVHQGRLQDLPTIGLQIEVPAPMTPLPVDTLTDWVRVGVKGSGERYDQILVLSALPEGTRHSAKIAAEESIRDAGKQRGEYRVLSQRPAEWLSDGWEVLATYRAEGRPVTSLQWFGRREGKPAIIYMLTYDVIEGRADEMRSVVQVAARSCKVAPIRPACTQPVRLSPSRQHLPKLGVSLQVPESLRMMVPNRENMVLRAGAVDYVRDRLVPVLTLTTNDVKAVETPQGRLKRSIDALLPSLRPMDGKVDSEGPAKIGALPAHQVMLDLTQRRERMRTGMRLAIWRQRALVLSLTYPADNAKELTEALEKVSASFQFEP